MVKYNEERGNKTHLDSVFYNNIQVHILLYLWYNLKYVCRVPVVGELFRSWSSNLPCIQTFMGVEYPQKKVPKEKQENSLAQDIVHSEHFALVYKIS